MRKTFFIICIFLFFNGCSHKPQQSIRIGLVDWIGYAPLYIADAKGWLPKNIEIEDYPANYDVIEAMQIGTIEMGALTLDEMLLHYQKLPDYKAVWFIDYSNGADSLMSAPSIKTLSDLKNKRVAFEPKSVQAYLLDRTLQKGGLAREDIHLKPMKSDSTVTAWKKKEIDAAATFEPTKSELIRLGMHTLFDSSQIPYEIIDLLIVKKAFIGDPSLQKLINAYNKALSMIQKEPEQSFAIIGKYLHMSSKEVKKALQEVQLLGCKENKTIIKEKLSHNFSQVATILKKRGVLATIPHIEEIFSFELIKNCKVF
ncbi:MULTISPECIES: ABC transporter substrate-binding protein [unclassified Nitratiruptor]|uniref:ABC transporter substrate-binding protein n=1 Tax=unclassified Nitratiruptor TaxID=2624044 RepID=UPI001916BF58|nr:MULTISPECIES: ABC transporter substrate-binding protein [unclassified Nitratiruptor]BCD61037.1 NitT/TauT family transport system substrate-binding protein [Nitratiruptor sp. YY08-10]BCD64969.1 NitT/TauT family transport system substrate-binding protein [Nitratiruptor sp. YY08-14]